MPTPTFIGCQLQGGEFVLIILVRGVDIGALTYERLHFHDGSVANRVKNGALFRRHDNQDGGGN